MLASDGTLARAIDESMDEIVKVPELFRSGLKERRSPACGARVFGDGCDDDARRSGLSPWVGYGFPSFPFAEKVDRRCKERDKGPCDNLGCGIGRMSGVANIWYQDAV